MDHLNPPVSTRPSSEQKRAARRQIDEAVGMVGIDTYRFQKVLRNGELRNGLCDLIWRLGNPENHYDHEVTEQKCFYPPKWSPPVLEVQAQNLADGLAGFQPKWREDASKLTVASMADGIALVPTFTALSKHWGISRPYRQGLEEMIEAICGSIAKERSFIDERQEGKLNKQNTRIPEQVLEVIELAEAEAYRQGCNCLALPFHFGDWKTGKCYSLRNAVWQTLNLSPARLPLPAVHIGCLLLEMPDRLSDSEHLFLDCCDEYDGNVPHCWEHSLYFYFSNDNPRGLKLSSGDVRYAEEKRSLPAVFLDT